jgi:hypothetical protein
MEAAGAGNGLAGGGIITGGGPVRMVGTTGISYGNRKAISRPGSKRGPAILIVRIKYVRDSGYRNTQDA